MVAPALGRDENDTGGTKAARAEVQASLVAAGCEVERFAGDGCTVERILAERIG